MTSNSATLPLTSEQDRTERHRHLLAKYCVPDMGDYSTVDSPLAFILEKLDTEKTLAAHEKHYLRGKGLFELHQFVTNLEDSGKADFSGLRSKFEKESRRHIGRSLRSKYGINDYVEPEQMGRLLRILGRIDKGGRFAAADLLWLTQNDLLTPGLKKEFHRREAGFCSEKFANSGDPWQAVNASSHYRKADMPSDALSVVSRVDLGRQKDQHLRSAICTTIGGSMRDLGRLSEAMANAEAAHSYDPKSFHPCTLFGALHYQLGNFALGDEWFRKAVERGASSEGIDGELRAIFRQVDKSKREELRRHLINLDPVRYAWADRSRIVPSEGKGSRKRT
jgi:hypothetical protein